MTQFTVDFSKRIGKIKALHGVNNAPYSKIRGSNQPAIQRMFAQAHIPYCRLHDTNGSYGGTYFVDVPNIFRDFDADENDPASYDFYYTDEYIAAIQKSGCETYYRLGVTIEWGSRKITSLPPKDFGKWARICEHIVRHYNEGWANGFHYHLKYWEIWNEPENPGTPEHGPCMWGGTREAFFELYSIAAKHLKTCFPDIKIGGYGSCGFYAITREHNPPGFDSFIVWFEEFLKLLKRKNVPLDFFSWHIYTADEKELLAHAKYVRETLDSYGFTETESHLNEWNVNGEGSGFAQKHTMVGGSFNAAVMCMLQNTPYVDKAMYYDFKSSTRYNGFLDQNDGSICPPWYSFVAFGRLYALGEAVETAGGGEGIYATAARGENGKALLVCNRCCQDGAVALELAGLEMHETVRVLRLNDGKNLEEELSFTASDSTKITLQIPKENVVLVTTGASLL